MIRDLLEKRKRTISFEVFPPKKDDEFENAFPVMDALSALHPDFISVTYGAGGSRSKKTLDIAGYIQNTLHTDALAHMTCVGSTTRFIDENIREMKIRGVRNILALRGDRPQSMTDDEYNAREFEHAMDLMKHLSENADITLAGACYPEKHYEAPSFTNDLYFMRRKEQMGASFFISQLFFDNDCFYRFMYAVRDAGITVPVLPGIMPITSANQIGRSVMLSGSSVPKKLADILANYADKPDDLRKAGIEFAVNQIRALLDHDAEGIHIYTMNRTKTTKEIVEAI